MRRTRSTATIALVTTLAFVSAGCAGRPWPTKYRATADPAFAAHGVPVATVDVLPIDVEVWANEDRADEGPEVRADASATALGAIAAALAGAGYRLSSVIDWYGRFSGPRGSVRAMHPTAVLATAGSLAAYGAAASRSPGLPVPYLPVRLGEHTGADATLYVGGWSYLGERSDGNGDEIATALLIAVGIIAVVAIAAAVSKSHKGGSGRRGGPSEPHTSAPHWPRGGGRGPRHHGGSVPGRAVGAIARTAAATGRVALRTLARSTEVAVRVGVDATTAIADASLRGAYVEPYSPGTRTHIEILAPAGPSEPSTVSAWRAPPGGGPSELYLEMTLVDNRTGRVLWHARQLFPADGARPSDVQRAVRGLLSTLPPAN